MSEIPNEEVSDRIKFLDEKFEKFKIHIAKKSNSSIHDEFVEVSEKLRDLLPKLQDSSLFKIDHILYPDQDWSDNDKSKRMDNYKELCDNIDFESYLSVYFRICTGKDAFENVVCDNAYLKVIKHMSLWDLTIKWTLEFLFDDKIPKAVCRGLKLMKIVLDTEYSDRYQTLDLGYVISRFRNIPTTDHKNENKNKIAQFIADLATKCYGKFEDEYKYKYEPKLDRPIESAKNLIINHIYHIIRMDDLSDIVRDLLYDVFTLQDDPNTRKEYLKYFLWAIITSQCQLSFNSGFEILINNILWNIINAKSDIVDKEMRSIDIRCGYKIDRYLNEKLDYEVKFGEDGHVFDADSIAFECFYTEVEKLGFANFCEEAEMYGFASFHKEAKRLGFEYFHEEIKRLGFAKFCKEAEDKGFAGFRCAVERHKYAQFHYVEKEDESAHFHDVEEKHKSAHFHHDEMRGYLFFEISRHFKLMPSKQLLADLVKAIIVKGSDYTLEKFFFYDGVMKNLQLLNIFYTAYSMRHSLLEGEFFGTDRSRGFICEPSVLVDQLGFYLNNPELLVPWHIEKTLKIFPFIVGLGQEDSVIDLIIILRGEKPMMNEELSKKIEGMKAIKSIHNKTRQKNVANYPKR